MRFLWVTSYKYSLFIPIVLFNAIQVFVDKYNILFFTLNGILIWLNLIHINIIIIKKNFIILINNIEYLIILYLLKILLK
uniref:Maxicircle unidentified reading frame 5 n=1 Tax=Trypanosoma vivax TaxID=5699 RepID=A0A0E3J9W8_TRYVI|nr:maxicircle unidentified reading frame 5 [Trypanosoma vivax]AJO53300.1 maxicircle unidentified reading frame 5 [Trypanosoma vivax]